jgi:diguanylate cyclase (GGDEF)-like protein
MAFDGQLDTATAERLAAAIAGSGSGVWDRNLVTGEIVYSPAWKAMLGYDDSDVGARIEESYTRVHPADLAMVQAAIASHQHGHTPAYEVEHRLRCKDGSYKWVLSRGKIVSRDANGVALRMTGLTFDISSTLALSHKLRASAELLADLTDQIAGVAFQFAVHADGQRQFTYVSAGVVDLFGCTAEQAYADPDAIEGSVHPDDRALVDLSMAEAAGGNGRWQCEFRLLVAGAGERWCHSQARARTLPDGGVLWHGFSADITERKQIERQLQDAAATDFLTGLPNRRDLMTCMEQELLRLRQDSQASAVVLMFDLDHFKSINDTHGHAVGDEVLKYFSSVLRQELRKVDAVGRIGGEEFAVVLSDADGEAAHGFAQRVRARLAGTPVWHDGRAIAVTVSSGVALMRAEDGSVTSSLSRADAALYRAKQSGRDCIAFAPGSAPEAPDDAIDAIDCAS